MNEPLIYLAPATLHLTLYDRILEKSKGCLQVTVLTLEAYLARSLSKPKTPKSTVLYQYKEALETLSEDNTFYESRADYDFLDACYDFLTIAQMYGLSEFPSEDKRDRDLKEIIERLLPIELWVKEAATMEFKDAKNVRIFETETDEAGRFFTRRLLEQGAKMAAKPEHQDFFYWSASNLRKETEAAAEAIVFTELNADGVLIALSDPKDRYVLSQSLESRGIPYTFTQEPAQTRVIECFAAALEYVCTPDRDHLIRVLKTLYGTNALDVCRFLELTGSLDLHLAEKPWRENSLISESDYQALCEMESQCIAWKPTIDQIQNWTLDSFEEIAEVIQTLIPDPTETDLQSAQGVRDSFEAIRPYLHRPSDLALYLRTLANLHPSSALASQKGVLIGSRKDISCLHENVFYIGADASSFPGSVQQRGIFGEEYLSRLPLPSLETRMNEHLESLKSVLMQPKFVTFLVGQSDYEGKAIEESHDLNMWLGQLPIFKATAETNNNVRPSFSIQDFRSQTLFKSEDNTIETRINELYVYDDCPLKNLLRYGLQLKTPPAPRDYLKAGANMIPAMMNRSLQMYGKPFYQLNLQEIENLVRDDFSFAREVFPAEDARISQLEYEASKKLELLFKRLGKVSIEMNLDLEPGSVNLDIRQASDGVSVAVEGPLCSTNFRHISFNLYPTEPAEGGIADPCGTLKLSLQPRMKLREANKVSYGSSAGPAAIQEIEPAAAAKESELRFFREVMEAQNLAGRTGKLSEALVEKVQSYKEREEQIAKQAEGFARGVSENRFKPLHTKTACVHCHFKAICRNAAVEKGEQA